MPDIITHYRYGNAVFEALPQPMREYLSREIYDFATIGPDAWFAYRFWSSKTQYGLPSRGTVMHHEKTGAFLQTLLRECLEAEGESKRQLFSYYAGFICHYTLDQTVHPYIIYYTGNYDGTPETLCFRGNHTYLERAIDLEVLREWPEGGRTPILKRILYMKKLPACIREGVERVYREVYNWENAYDSLNRCIADQRRFYALVQDPYGIMDPILRRADSGSGHNDLSSLSYHGKAREDLDVMNRSHREWCNPWAHEMTSNESFDELWQKAQRNAAKILEQAWSILHLPDAHPAQVRVGNISYETGLDCEDPRNAARPKCLPLPLKKGSK